ncbi:Fe-S cluster assembly protein SufD [Mesoterricola silvestris]|uniref:Fe-S cluster assembly protein SufD n=1 Tax=Mesoterricola silvestris TaxID=2927979 RepID=A0AA48K9C1_9BACT|nr:Fe-S cluster assembly protein SufD [Mesoterricola silvestris]BDU73849.1 Fe-S cluster assembly protein SufD [Mesoterricola silvestris]
MVATEAAPLLEGLLSRLRPSGWEALRARAEAALEGQDLPTPRQEDWKYTDLAPMRGLDFAPGEPAAADISAIILPEARGSRLVFVNGHYAPHASNVTNLPAGVRFLNLACATEMARDLGTLSASDVFADLNLARFKDGALVVVPKGVQVEAPLHLVFVNSQEGAVPTCALPRLLVVVERGASATVVEEHLGTGTYLTSAVAEVIVREDGRLTHERIQRESDQAFHFSHVAARVERGASYACRTISFGARISRTTPHVVMAAEGAELSLDGLALLGGSQLSDTHSFVDHTVPHGTCRQAHKVIADDASRAVFNGKVFVRPGAQGTDAQQQCRGLLLSPKARIDTKPELEIFADDVKCAHGAAIGQLDPEGLFYLQSRGMDPALARNVLTYAFAADLLARIPVTSLRRQLRQTVLARTQSGTLEALS